MPTRRGVDMVYRNGLMVLSMRENGRTIKLKAEELSGMLKETFMLVTLRQTRLMGKVSTLM
jgi:hypothetical protein